ncbi:hypothetical protein JCM4914_72220 [Streptomyces platensis subsp. malvinus]
MGIGGGRQRGAERERGSGGKSNGYGSNTHEVFLRLVITREAWDGSRPFGRPPGRMGPAAGDASYDAGPPAGCRQR